MKGSIHARLCFNVVQYSTKFNNNDDNNNNNDEILPM